MRRTENLKRNGICKALYRFVKYLVGNGSFLSLVEFDFTDVIVLNWFFHVQITSRNEFLERPNYKIGVKCASN